ncbi:hypothetical protein ILUMI_04940 [Ignelater luminosus]|uniref:Uncharacterized protein n=1 Tax=Ignelater luminosus TaxID=2038154 RepID=A0A8K0DBI3_IGNLU|nr:hypothetical protein ILUMI_04940 [Ignelater luminosus]
MAVSCEEEGDRASSAVVSNNLDSETDHVDCPRSSTMGQPLEDGNNPGRVIRLQQVAKLFCGAYREAATLDNIISGFEKSRVFPLNHDVFSDWMFLASSVTDLPIPEHFEGVVTNKAK